VNVLDLGLDNQVCSGGRTLPEADWHSLGNNCSWIIPCGPVHKVSAVSAVLVPYTDTCSTSLQIHPPDKWDVASRLVCGMSTSDPVMRICMQDVIGSSSMLQNALSAGIAVEYWV
jgi:hypothetical protein